jgi:RNA polymerase sigma-70 factor (ECF subfamily)
LEARYQIEIVDLATPETAFEKHWALAVLDRTMDRLAREHENAGKRDVFELLKETLTGQKLAISRANIAARCGVTPGAVDVAVHRLRRRYGELLREEIAHTVSQPEDVENEIRHLKAVLARG